MDNMIRSELGFLAGLSSNSVAVTTKEISPNQCPRKEPSPDGATVIEYSVPGLPLVRLVGRKKGADSHMKTGNLENTLWNVMEEDVPILVVLDTDMAPKKDMLQYLLPSFFKLSAEGRWVFDWETAFVSSPQSFTNIEECFGTDDPLNQMRKSYWRELPAALDSMALCISGARTQHFSPQLCAHRMVSYTVALQRTL
jgi:hypothetical protein